MRWYPPPHQCDFPSLHYSSSALLLQHVDNSSRLQRVIPSNSKILLLYGGGSIKHNGIYEQVIGELSSFDVIEFGGIEANPQYTTLTKALEVIKLNEIKRNGN